MLQFFKIVSLFAAVCLFSLSTSPSNNVHAFVPQQYSVKHRHVVLPKKTIQEFDVYSKSYSSKILSVIRYDPPYFDNVVHSTALRSSSSSVNNNNDDNLVDDPLIFDAKTTVTLVGGQSLLIGLAAIVAIFTGTPKFGLGPGFALTVGAVQKGLVFTIPLAILVWILDRFEDRVPALQDVTKATQRSVLALLGGSFRPIVALLTALALGLVAGLGEEMLFRGVLQYEIGSRFGDQIAIIVASIVFGALHAVTPVYALLASLASAYFGWLYILSGNLLVPIITHAVYDVGALLYAHWTIVKMSPDEQLELAKWEGPLDAIANKNKNNNPSDR